MAELNLDQQKAIALASARMRMSAQDNAPAEQGIGDKIVQDWKQNYANGEASDEAVRSGEIGPLHYAVQKLGEGPVGYVAAPVKEIASNLLSAIPTTQGVRNTMGRMGQAVSGYLSDKPNLSRDLQSAENVAAFLPLLPGSGERPVVNMAGRQTPVLNEDRPAVVQGAGVDMQPALPPITAAQAKQVAGQNYDTANYLGEKFTPDELSNPFVQAVNDTMPKPIAGTVLTAEDKKLMGSLSDYTDLKGKDITLEDLNRIDQTLGQKITDNHIDPRTGAPDATGRQLMGLQTKLRGLAEDAGTTGGNDARVNGVNAWATQARLNDINAIVDRASVANNPESAMQAGYRALYNDKDRIRGWPAPAVDALRAAAQPGVSGELLSTLTNRLPAMIGLGTGDFTGAAGLQLGNMAARGIRGGVLAKRGLDVQNALGDDLISKLRDVNVPAPEYPEQQLLAPPDKMGPLPMSDGQVNVAQQLMARTGKGGQSNPDVLSGGVLQPNKFNRVTPFESQSAKVTAVPPENVFNGMLEGWPKKDGQKFTQLLSAASADNPESIAAVTGFLQDRGVSNIRAKGAIKRYLQNKPQE